MTAITIDKDKALELLEKQVEKKGADYVYPFDECIYFAEGTQANKETGERPECGTPLCILGNVYADLGLTVDDLLINEEVEDEDGYSHFEWVIGQAGALGDGILDVRPNEEKVVLTAGAQRVLRTAQANQDTRASWGTALDRAREVAKEAVA